MGTKITREGLKHILLACFDDPFSEPTKWPKLEDRLLVEEALEVLCSHFDNEGWPEESDRPEFGIATMESGRVLACYVVRGEGMAWVRHPGQSNWVLDQPRPH